MNEEQLAAIRQSVASIIGPHATASVYGSRLNDQARGGDLDLLIADDELPTLLQKARLKLALESALSMPVDIRIMTK